MTTINVVFLFTKVSSLSVEQQQRIEQLVREVYCIEFTCSASEVESSLCDGSGAARNDYDIALAISSDKKVLNEGVHRDNLRKAVSQRLRTIIPRHLGFNGRVGLFDGELEKIPPESPGKPDKPDKPELNKNYVAEEPRMTFDMLQLPKETLEQIELATKRIELEREIFDEWGLYAIMPNPVCALNFYGEGGTGKTLAADALANKLGKKIIRASYADIESKYHGEGPKNVNAIFKAAEAQKALLFIDEADSLLSKRLTNVTQGSEQAINSMRAQILICLERFNGIVVFASNLIVNYDKAFLSRLISVEFSLPDAKMREKIWRAHLCPNPDSKAKYQLKIPLADDINLRRLAKKYQLCGRDIRNCVIAACVLARSENSSVLTQKHLTEAVHQELKRLEKLAAAKDHTDAGIILSGKSEKMVRDFAEKKITARKKSSSEPKT